MCYLLRIQQHPVNTTYNNRHKMFQHVFFDKFNNNQIKNQRIAYLSVWAKKVKFLFQSGAQPLLRRPQMHPEHSSSAPKKQCYGQILSYFSKIKELFSNLWYYVVWLFDVRSKEVWFNDIWLIIVIMTFGRQLSIN